MATATKSAIGPVEHIAGLPVYKHGTAPKHLRSKSQLRTGLRLKLGPGQSPECYVIPYYHPDERTALYDPAAAVPLADQRIGSVWAWAARRTCPKCGEVREYVVHGRQCGECRRAEQAKAMDRRERRCDGCKRVGRKQYPKVKEGWTYRRLCRACRAEFNRKIAAALAEAVLCPGGCGKRTGAKSRILAWAVEKHQAIAHYPRRYCPPCDAVHQAAVAARDAENCARWEKQRAEERAREEAREAARRAELAELRQWAIAALADPDVVILDTETTGLHDTARIVDIAVITTTGETLLNTLVNPGEPIPREASNIHGITDQMVAGAPTFADIVHDLGLILAGRRILIYNAAYDTRVLNYELGILKAEAEDSSSGIVAELIGKVDGEDVMVPYSDWYGEEDEWHGGYRWQRLGGGHRAHGDCLAVIDCLKAMARPSVYETEDEG